MTVTCCSDLLFLSGKECYNDISFGFWRWIVRDNPRIWKTALRKVTSNKRVTDHQIFERTIVVEFLYS